METKNAIPSFTIEKPTMDEYRGLKEEDILDISVPNWDPSMHNMDSNALVFKTTQANNTQVDFMQHPGLDEDCKPELQALLTASEHPANDFLDLEEDPSDVFFDAFEEDPDNMFMDAFDIDEDTMDNGNSGENNPVDTAGEEQPSEHSGEKRKQVRFSMNPMKLFTTMTAAMTSIGKSEATMQTQMHEQEVFHDCDDYGIPPLPGTIQEVCLNFSHLRKLNEQGGKVRKGRNRKVMHTLVAHQIIDGCNTNGEPRFGTPNFLPNKMVGAFLTDMDCENITGQADCFDTLVNAMWTMEKLQKLEQLQPHLAWKPLRIIE